MALIPTHGLRWNNGVLEQMFQMSHSGGEVWKSVPNVPRNPNWATPLDACIHCKSKPCMCAVAQASA